MSFTWVNKYAVLIIVILCLLSRLPLILTENLFLDGDECIVGLMAKHFSEGIDVPYFFYGQSYGFSFIEVVAIRIFYWLFGISDLSIKLSMLFLWTIGIIFFYKTLKESESKNNRWAPLLITLVLVVSPSFAIWSMKARGGYLTAFLLSSVITWLIFNKKYNTFLFTPLILGFLLTVVYQSQPLWLPGLIPIMAYYLFKNKNIRFLVSLSGGVLTGTLLFFSLTTNLSNFWSPEVFSWSNISLNTIISIPKVIYHNLTGSYDYGTFIPPNVITKSIAWLTTALIFCTLLTGLIYYITKRKITPNFYTLCFSVLFTIGYLPLLSGSNPRYLLPLSGFALFMFYLLIINFNKNTIINSFLVFVILLGTYSIYDFRNDVTGDKSATISAIHELESRNIKYVYCEHGLLQWQLMFYSKEKIIARYKSNVDRYPKYIQQVDDALNDPSLKTALVGQFNPELVASSASFISINDKFFIYENPSRELLVTHWFDLNKIDNKE